MIFFDYNKIKDFNEGNIHLKCYNINNIWICVSPKNKDLIKKLESLHSSIKPVKIIITDKIEKNSYYYLNYLDYNKIKDAVKPKDLKIEDISINCYHNGNKWICVSSTNIKLSEQFICE